MQPRGSLNGAADSGSPARTTQTEDRDDLGPPLSTSAAEQDEQRSEPESEWPGPIDEPGPLFSY